MYDHEVYQIFHTACHTLVLSPDPTYERGSGDI